MKKFSLLVSTILCALLLASCNMISNVGYVTGGKEKTTLTLSVASFVPSRNILPNEWTDERAGNLKYKLTGSKTSGGANEVPENEFSYSDIISGKATIALEPVEWFLVLTAYQVNGTDYDVALISEEKTVDLSTGSKTVEFALAATTEATNATGDLLVTVIFPKPEDFWTVTYGLYDRSAHGLGQLIDSAEEKYLEDTELDPYVYNAAENLYKLTYSVNGLKASKNGYYFNITINDNSGNHIFYRTEPVWIDGGNLSSKQIRLTEDMFNKPPKKVSNLKVTYDFTSPVEVEDAADIPLTYNATFEWDDNSDNETGFEIYVIDDDSTVTPYTVPAATTSKVIELNTGVNYTVKIRAVNYFSPDYDENGSDVVTLNDVNVFTLNYFLNDGRVKTSNTETTADTVTYYVVPYNKSSDAVTLMTDSTSSFPYVYRTNYNFVKWEDGNGVEVTEISAGNSENITVVAKWSSTLGLTVSFPLYDEFNKELTTSVLADAVLEVNGTTEDSVSLTTADGVTDVTFNVFFADYETPVYSFSDSFDWTITDVDGGSYLVVISGKVNGYTVSENVTIKIKR